MQNLLILICHKYILQPPKPNPPHKETEEERQFRALFEQIAGEVCIRDKPILRLCFPYITF